VSQCGPWLLLSGCHHQHLVAAGQLKYKVDQLFVFWSRIVYSEQEEEQVSDKS